MSLSLGLPNISLRLDSCVFGKISQKCCCVFVRVFPWWLTGKECTCQCRSLRFHPWVGKVLRRRKWQPTPVFLSRESRGQKSPRGHRESNTTERLTLSLSLYCWLHISVPKFKLIELYAKIKMINFTLSFSPNLLIYKSARKIPGCHIYPFLFILKYTVQWVLVYSKYKITII